MMNSPNLSNSDLPVKGEYKSHPIIHPLILLFRGYNSVALIRRLENTC